MFSIAGRLVRAHLDFSTYFEIIKVLHCHDTRQKNDFHMHTLQFEIEKKIIRNKGTKLWNDLPDDIKQITSPSFFKYRLKCHKLQLSRTITQGRIKTLGGPMPKCHGALPFPPLPFPLRPFPPPSSISLPVPPVPSSAISLPSFYLFSFRSGHLNTAMGPGERCSPSRQTIWCIFESKRAALAAAIFLYSFTQEYM